MNGLEEVREIIRKFIYEKQQVNKQISEIEEKRTQLAQERNQKKNACINNCEAEISVLGNQICELGVQSQELQNKLDSKFYETRTQVNLIIDNLITEGIRKTRIIEAERHELKEKIALQKERSTKYEIQKQEFYERFGRVPELSENAIEENRRQKEDVLASKEKIKEIDTRIEETIETITELARIKREFKNKNWAKIIQPANENSVIEEVITLPLEFEEIEVEEIPQQELQIEEILVEEFGTVEELIVEEFEPIEEIQVEEFISPENIEERKPLKEFITFGIEDDEEFEQNIWQIQEPVEEIEKIAKAIVEEIAAEQTKDLRIQEVVEKPIEEEIITFEENVEKEIAQVKEQPITLSNIIAKIENGEIVYKAQVSNGKEIRIYPTKTIIGNQILRDKEKREELKTILTNYAVEKHIILDKKVINKIDPTVCEILVVFANIYNYDAQSLIYNYAMSFSKHEEYDASMLPTITYNFAYMNSAYLSKKEKTIITKICKNARKNEKIDMIGYNSKISSIKYLFKRIFALNIGNALPEGEVK